MTTPSTESRRELLFEIGQLYTMLENHRSAARFCRDQLKQRRLRLAELEQLALADQSERG